MELNICQSCKEAFDQNKDYPKQQVVAAFIVLNVTDIIKCKIHKIVVSIEEQNLKDFNIKEYFMKEINKFEQQANLIQLIKDLSGQSNVKKSNILRIKQTTIEIVKQVTWTMYQKEVNNCQKSIVQIEDVLRQIKKIYERYQQIKSSKVATSQECNNNMNILNNLVKEFEGLQNEIKRVRGLNYQDTNQNYKIIQEVSFLVLQEIMNMNQEQRSNLQEFSVFISKNIVQQNSIRQNQKQVQKQSQEKAKDLVQRQDIQQNIQKQTNQQVQPVQIEKQPLQEIKIESIQHLQNILNEFQNQQIDMSSILNNPLNIVSICQNQLTLNELIQLKSEKSQQHLLQILNLSKNQPKMQVAATNALKMLNYMDFTFTNQNLQNINLSNSDLSDTTFTSSNLRNTKFVNCDLSNANLSSIITEFPYIFTGHTSDVTAVTITSDQEFIVSGSRDKTMRLWDVKTGACKTMSGHTSQVLSVAISSDSEFIVSGSYDKTMRLYDVKTLQRIKVLSGHTSYVFSVIFSSTNKFIISGSEDKTIRV